MARPFTLPLIPHLGVLQEGVSVVDAASGAVLQRVFVPRPLSSQDCLFPRLVDAQVGRVDEAALDDIGEVSAEVLKRHPRREKRNLGEYRVYKHNFLISSCWQEESVEVFRSK